MRSVTDDDVYAFVMEVAAGDHDVGALATRLRELAAS
jgi:hypothetical protein